MNVGKSSLYSCFMSTHILKNWISKNYCFEAEKYFKEAISLPIFPSMTNNQFKYIAFHVLINFLNEYNSWYSTIW